MNSNIWIEYIKWIYETLKLTVCNIILKDKEINRDIDTEREKEAWREVDREIYIEMGKEREMRQKDRGREV